MDPDDAPGQADVANKLGQLATKRRQLADVLTRLKGYQALRQQEERGEDNVLVTHEKVISSPCGCNKIEGRKHASFRSFHSIHLFHGYQLLRHLEERDEDKALVTHMKRDLQPLRMYQLTKGKTIICAPFTHHFLVL